MLVLPMQANVPVQPLRPWKWPVALSGNYIEFSVHF